MYFGQWLPETQHFNFYPLVAVSSEKREKSSAVINQHCTVDDHGFYTQK